MSNTKNKRLIESVSFTDVQFVEAADGNPRMIKGVALLGGVAKRGKNSYSYPVRTMETAVRAGKYDSCRCFINHPSDKEVNAGRRNLNDLAGIVVNPRVESGKIKGDVRLLPDQYGDKFYNIAKLMPEAASCSHIADGKLKREGNNLFVEEIKEVLSVDLVVQGATTQNVFESQDYQKGSNDMEYSDITISDLRIKCPDIVKTLIEEGHKSRDDEVKKLTESETELKGKIDEHDVKEKVAVRKADVATLLEESKLPKTAKTDIFREQLVAIDSEGDDFKKEAKKLIEDRATVIGGVKNMGGGGGGNKNNSDDGDFESGLDALHSDD